MVKKRKADIQGNLKKSEQAEKALRDLEAQIAQGTPPEQLAVVRGEADTPAAAQATGPTVAQGTGPVAAQATAVAQGTGPTVAQGTGLTVAQGTGPTVAQGTGPVAKQGTGQTPKVKAKKPSKRVAKSKAAKSQLTRAAENESGAQAQDAGTGQIYQAKQREGTPQIGGIEKNDLTPQVDGAGGAQSKTDKQKLRADEGEKAEKTSQDNQAAQADQADQAKQPKRSKRRIWLPIAISIIVVCIVGSCAVVAWDRWFRFDDTADFQGQWIDAKMLAPVTIDSEKIHLSSDVAYPYELNTWDKTVNYSFSHLRGQAMYLFSPDRNTLYIVEGEQRDIVADTLRMVDLAQLPDYASNGSATILVKGTAAANAIAAADAARDAAAASTNGSAPATAASTNGPTSAASDTNDSTSEAASASNG